MAVINGRECVRGIDVSKYQGNIDWTKVAQNAKFAWIKAAGADGGLYQDNTYGQNLNGTKNAGIPAGAYYFMHGAFSGTQQGNHFCDVVGNYPLALPPALDVEHSTLSRQHAVDFIAVLDQRIGKRWTGPTGKPVSCVIYTGKPFQSITRGFADYDLWLAAYLSPTYPNPGPDVEHVTAPENFKSGSLVPDGWPRWSIWQAFGEDGRIQGVNGACDQDFATVECINRLLKQTTGDWLDMATKDEVKAALKELLMSDDEVQSAIGKKAAYWVLRARAEGQQAAIDMDLPDLKKLVDQWTKNSTDPVNNPHKADKLDWIVTATEAHA